jgi:NADPH:quinone reductase-like Zn-dependent oxidoreductase
MQPVVEHGYPFKEIAGAHAHVEQDHTRGKVVVRI